MAASIASGVCLLLILFVPAWATAQEQVSGEQKKVVVTMEQPSGEQKGLVFTVEEALELPGGHLSRILGYLPASQDGVKPSSVPDAVVADPLLDDTGVAHPEVGNDWEYDANGDPVVERIPNTTSVRPAVERGIQYIGKLTFAVNPDNQLELSIYGAPSDSGGSGQGNR